MRKVNVRIFNQHGSKKVSLVSEKKMGKIWHLLRKNWVVTLSSCYQQALVLEWVGQFLMDKSDNGDAC